MNKYRIPLNLHAWNHRQLRMCKIKQESELCFNFWRWPGLWKFLLLRPWLQAVDVAELVSSCTNQEATWHGRKPMEQCIPGHNSSARVVASLQISCMEWHRRLPDSLELSIPGICELGGDLEQRLRGGVESSKIRGMWFCCFAHISCFDDTCT